MNLLGATKNLFEESKAFVKTNKFYYESHLCIEKKENIKVDMSIMIKDTSTNDIINIGMCPHCKTVFYHEDYENKTF